MLVGQWAAAAPTYTKWCIWSIRQEENRTCITIQNVCALTICAIEPVNHGFGVLSNHTRLEWFVSRVTIHPSAIIILNHSDKVLRITRPYETEACRANERDSAGETINIVSQRETNTVHLQHC